MSTGIKNEALLIAEDEIRRERDLFNKRIRITVESHINADGFSISLMFKNIPVKTSSYMYGYNASYRKYFASKEAPYVEDIIKKWMTEYPHVKIEVVAGKNIYTGKNVADSEVEDFYNEYVKDIEEIE